MKNFDAKKLTTGIIESKMKDTDNRLKANSMRTFLEDLETNKKLDNKERMLCVYELIAYIHEVTCKPEVMEDITVEEGIIGMAIKHFKIGRQEFKDMDLKLKYKVNEYYGQYNR